MVAAGVTSTSGKRPFAAFVAASEEGLRREVRGDARRRGLPPDIDVDDVVQTAYARLLPVYDRLDTEFAAYNYAHKTALHALRDARRRDRVRHDGWLETVYRRHHRAPVDPEEEALRGLRAADVRRALGRLPLSQRRAVALVDLAELRQVEAADVMGVTPTILKGLVQRGRERLRRDLLEVPGIAALFRLRRPLLAPAATAPAVMAALLLTVVHGPAVPRPAPYSAEVAAPRPAYSVSVRTPAETAAAPVRTPARRPAARPAPATRPAAPKPAAPPAPAKQLPGGACVGDTCAGTTIGDRVCVDPDRQGTADVCANQSLVGMCPVTRPAEPIVRCERSTTPMVEPFPAL